MLPIEKSFEQLIDAAFTKINRFKDGNALFYSKFPKSRAVVSNWKSGKVVPTESDKGLFLKTASEVIKQLKIKEEKLDRANNQLLSEFTSLVSA